MTDPLDAFDPRTLKAARLARNMTVADLSRAANVLPTTIMRIETEGNDPRTLRTWVPLVTALKATALESAAA